MQLRHPAFLVIEPGHESHEPNGEPLRLGGRGGGAGGRAIPDGLRLRVAALGVGEVFDAVVGGPAARGGEVGMPALERRAEARERVGPDTGRVGEPPHPGPQHVGLSHLERGIGPKRRDDPRLEGRAAGRLRAADRLVKFKAVGGVVGRAHHLHIHPREDAPRGEVARGKLPIGLLPDPVGRGGLEQFIDAEVAAKLEVGPVEERVAERVGHRRGPGGEFFARGGRPGDEVLRHSVGPHRPPLVVIPVEPDGVEVFEPAVLGDVARAQMAVVIDDRLRRGHAAIEVCSHVVRKQEGVVAEWHRRSGSGV